MTNNDLIERLKEYEARSDFYGEDFIDNVRTKDIGEAIAALSPGLPDDVARIHKNIATMADTMPGWENLVKIGALREAADLIERLAREKELYKADTGMAAQKQVITELQQRIEELQITISKRDRRLSECKQRIEELERRERAVLNIARDRQQRIEELQAEQPDKAEIIELRKACKIYADNNKAYRAQIAELEKALEKIAKNKVLVEHDSSIRQQPYGERKVSQFARTELERIRGMK